MATIGTFDPKGLIAGDFPTETQEIVLTGPADFKRGDVIAQADNGSYALVNSAGTGRAALAIGIICDDIVVETGAASRAVMYIKGEFNQRYLVFGGVDTVDDHLRRMTEIGLIPRGTRI